MSDKYPVFIAIDSQNLYHSCRFEFGNEAKVDYRKLQELLIANLKRFSSNLHVEAVVYTVASDKRQSNQPFLSMLQAIGFLTQTQFVAYSPRGARSVTRTEWNVGITIDAMKHVLGTEEPIKRFILVSGSGAFEPLIRELNIEGVPTDVYGFKQSISNSLPGCADQIFVLSKSILLDNQDGHTY